MQDLPGHLRQEMAVFLNRSMLENMDVFSKCSVPFLTAILSNVYPTIRLKGDIIFCEGEVGDEQTCMYFIISGEVIVYKSTVGKVGTWFPYASSFQACRRTCLGNLVEPVHQAICSLWHTTGLELFSCTIDGQTILDSFENALLCCLKVVELCRSARCAKATFLGRVPCYQRAQESEMRPSR